MKRHLANMFKRTVVVNNVRVHSDESAVLDQLKVIQESIDNLHESFKVVHGASTAPPGAPTILGPEHRGKYWRLSNTPTVYAWRNDAWYWTVDGIGWNGRCRDDIEAVPGDYFIQVAGPLGTDLNNAGQEAGIAADLARHQRDQFLYGNSEMGR